MLLARAKSVAQVGGALPAEMPSSATSHQARAWIHFAYRHEYGLDRCPANNSEAKNSEDQNLEDQKIKEVDSNAKHWYITLH